MDRGKAPPTFTATNEKSSNGKICCSSSQPPPPPVRSNCGPTTVTYTAAAACTGHQGAEVKPIPAATQLQAGAAPAQSPPTGGLGTCTSSRAVDISSSDDDDDDEDELPGT